MSEDKKRGNPNWKPGVSGNPKGRPPLGESMTELMREFLDGTEEGQTVPRKQQLIRKIALKAYKEGDYNAIKLIWNYLDGMPTQKILTKDLDELKEIPIDELSKIINDRLDEGEGEEVSSK